MRSTCTALALLLISGIMHGQTTTTNATCNVYGTIVQCNSTTTDTSAQARQSYEAGQQLGSALGSVIARGIMAHRIHKAAKAECSHLAPGALWTLQNNLGQRWSGNCPTK